MKNSLYKYYTPFFCEENCWKLLNSFSSQSLDNFRVLILTNKFRTIALANQSAGPPDRFILWDYHVIVWDSEESLIYDLGSTLGIPVSTSLYYEFTFTDQSLLPEELRTSVRVIPAIHYIENFYSDRSHMLGDKGKVLKPFPDWPVIQRGNLTLSKILDFNLSDHFFKEFLPVSTFFDDI